MHRTHRAHVCKVTCQRLSVTIAEQTQYLNQFLHKQKITTTKQTPKNTFNHKSRANPVTQTMHAYISQIQQAKPNYHLKFNHTKTKLYLRMVLEAIKPLNPVLNRSHRTLLAPRNDFEPIRQPSHLIPMAHPHKLPIPNPLRPVKRGALLHPNLHPPILLLLSDPDLAAEPLNNELQPITNPQNHDAVGLRPFGEFGRKRRGIGGVDGVGSAGEDDDAWVERGDGFERGSAGNAEGEDGEGSDSARDEMGVLGSEV